MTGGAGLYYAYQRMIAEAVLALELIESDLRKAEGSDVDELGSAVAPPRSQQ